jgi:FMN phosphatase YigB (HAD superfamily)
MNRSGKPEIKKINSKDIDTIVLGFDGTVATILHKAWIVTNLEALSRLANKEVTVEDELYKNFMKLGVDPEIGWRKAYLQLGGNHQDFSQTVNNMNRAEHLEFDPELSVMMESLHEEVVKVVVFSGANYWPVIEGLSVLLKDKLAGALRTIDQIITSDVLGGNVGKPDRKAYGQMLVMCGIDPRRAVMVDDHPLEIVSAQDLGMKGVLVGDHSEAAVKKAQPVAQIKNVHALLSIFSD